MKKVAFITGAEGFVGGHLAAALLNNGYEVYGTALNEKDTKNHIGAEKMIVLNICDKVGVFDAIAKIKPDILFHLAAQSSVALSWKNPDLTVDVNLKGTINLLEAVRAFCPNCRMVLIGSSEEYGLIDYSKPVSEEAELNPQNFYAITKEAQERTGKLYAKAFNMNVMMTRSFNHFGSGQATSFVIADFCNQVAKIEKGLQEPVINVGNLQSKRDFIYIDDVIRAYLLIADKGISGEIYNVGSGNPRLISDILNKIISFSKSKISVNIDKTRFRPIDVYSIQADTSKIQKIGFLPKCDFEQSLLETLNYYREHTIA